jgi:hypothetical protein
MRLDSILVLALAGVLACEEVDGGGESSPSANNPTDSGGSGGPDAPGPSDGAVAMCRDTCDDELFFDCIDADRHEVCWNACPERSESDIELFRACVLNSAGACDPGCIENFLDADPVDSSGGEPDTTAGGGPGTSEGGTNVSCEDACEAFAGRGCNIDFAGFDSCASFCASLDPTLHDFVVMCVELADGCMLPEQCTFPEGD